MSSPVIYNVAVDSGITQLTITGTNFIPVSAAPTVEFNGSNLTLVSSSNTSIVATLPSGLSSGTYELIVSNSDNFSCPIRYEVVIELPVSELVAPSYQGTGAAGPVIGGYVTNILVSSTAVTIPASGIGLSASGTAAYTVTPQELSILLTEPLPIGAGTLNVTFKDVTTSVTIGAAPISSGGMKVTWNNGSPITVTAGDIIELIISVTGSQTLLPSITWGLF